MKSFLTTILFVALCSMFSFGQVLLVNKTNCALNYQVAEVLSGTCTVIQMHTVTVPPHNAIPLNPSAAGTEFNRAHMSFVTGNCVSMNLAAPNNTCITCPITWLSSAYSFQANCMNNCQGTTFNLRWFDCTYPGNGIPQIVVYQ